MKRIQHGSEAALLCVEARDAAGLLGMSPRAVRNLVARGELEARSDGGKLLIPVSSVERLRSALPGG